MSDNYVIFNPEGGLGKIIASTAIIKAIKTKYPDHKIIVITPWADVYLNNPNIYRIYRSMQHPYFYKDYIMGRDSVVLKGEPYFETGHLYSKQHLIKSWCELHDLPFSDDLKPEIFFTPVEKEYFAANIIKDRPILLMQTNGGPYDQDKPYSWTRDIPHGQAQILANELSKTYKILHITRPKCPALQNVERVDHVPSKRAFLSLLLKSDKRLLIDSCMQHAAAALNLPSTVLWVGTSPDVFGYEMHKNIKPTAKKREIGTQFLDSIIFDHDFNGIEHEYPYESLDIFHLQSIFDSLVK